MSFLDDPKTLAEWRIVAFHRQQVIHAQRRTIKMLFDRVARLEADRDYYRDDYEAVMRMCRAAGFSPYEYENAEGKVVDRVFDSP